MIVGPLVFVALGVGMLLLPTDGGGGPVIAVLCIVFFGACAIMGTRMLLGKPEILRVDDAGISSQRGGFVFDWPAVVAVYVVSQRAGYRNQVHLAVDGAPRISRSFMRRLGWINSRLVPIPASASEGTVTWVPGTAPSVDEALAAIHAVAPHIPIHDRR